MSAVYSSYLIEPTETVEQRQAKLYLGIISMGETLYQKGAAVAEMNKEFLLIEKELTRMRQELKDIRKVMEASCSS